MKMAFIARLRRRLTALGPGNWRDTVNRHPKIANLIAVIVILLVVVDVGRQLGLPGSLLTARHSFAPRPKPLKFLNVRNLHCPAQFITAMVSDGYGGAYVAGEDSGIYHYLSGSAWQHYDKANSPGLISNHIYSLCLDAKGRLWAGTLRHGVCVYNGVKWKHYGLLNGPLGCHVVAIVSDPYDKSVWMCTEAGISIYETGKHTWRKLMRVEIHAAIEKQHYATASTNARIFSLFSCAFFNQFQCQFSSTAFPRHLNSEKWSCDPNEPTPRLSAQLLVAFHRVESGFCVNPQTKPRKQPLCSAGPCARREIPFAHHQPSLHTSSRLQHHLARGL